MMTKHPHAELMLQYAQDAMETDKPWERWETSLLYKISSWVDLDTHPVWSVSNEYRRKPQTIRIGEYDVPEPVRDAKGLGLYYAVDLCSPRGGTVEDQWRGTPYDLERLERGLIHRTREAAELHAKALLSFTKKQS